VDTFFRSEDGSTIYYWPYCPHCHEPFSFDDEAPFAYCGCGTSEWGNPRPASWIPDPNTGLELLKAAKALNGLEIPTRYRKDVARLAAMVALLEPKT
jgi:hypothetical protein